MSMFARLAAPSTLLTGLTSYWKMEETGANPRLDVNGTNNLAAVNNPVAVTGKVNLACGFVSASTQYLSAASNAGLQIGNNNRTFSSWVKLTDKSTFYAISGKNNGTSVVGSEFLFYYNNGTDRFEVAAYQGVATVVTVQANNFGSPTAGIWYNAVCWYDATNGKVGISINDITETDGNLVGGCNATATAFTIGATAFPTSPMNGAIDAAGWWSRVLTSTEKSSLYNGGAAAPYPFIGMP